jgi:hypothetical protein
MFGASCDADHAAAVQPHQPGPAGAAWPGDDAGHLTLERAGRQLPHRAALFQHGGGWSQVHWLLIQTHLRQPQATYLRVGDAVVVTQAGAERHGLERFFSSLFGKPVPGLAFFAFALVNVQQRTAHPLRRGQILRPERAAEPVAVAPAAPVAKRGRGRPKGSQNRNQAAVALAPYLSFSVTLLQAVRQVLGTSLVVTYVVLDGAFGNHYALQLVRRCQYDLISKLAVNSALFFLYDGLYSGRGPHKQYGAKVNYAQLPARYLKQTTTEQGICTAIYQCSALHKLFAQTLNVVTPALRRRRKCHRQDEHRDRRPGPCQLVQQRSQPDLCPDHRLLHLALPDRVQLSRRQAVLGP